MEDLDLDELDQAVNKMMSKPKKRPAKKTEVLADAPAEPAVVATKPAEANPADLPLLQNRQHNLHRMRPGAMDIMPNNQKERAPSERPPRVAQSVRPLEPKPKPAAPTVARPVAARPARLMNDVFLPQRPKPKIPTSLQPEAEAPKNEPKPAEPPQPILPEVTEEEPPKAVVEPTPFVTTKVEKRPLGAYAQAPAAESEKPKQIKLEEPEPAVAPKETDKQEMAEASLQSQQHLEDAASAQESFRQMSIPDQYKSETKEPKDDVHAVYDIKEYHMPPTPIYGVRKSSPWLIIGIVSLVTVLIVVVLVGYLMMTGAFDLSKI